MSALFLKWGGNKSEINPGAIVANDASPTPTNALSRLVILY